LHSAAQASPQIADERAGDRHAALPDHEGRDQFRVSVECHEHVLITDLQRVKIADALLFLGDISPDLIDLKASAWKPAHPLIEEPLTPFTGAVRQAHGRITMDASHALD
jgi:hypothetical protein